MGERDTGDRLGAWSVQPGTAVGHNEADAGDAAGNPAGEHSPDLLELRIHGVRNTPPHEMLRTTPERITLCCGDTLAGFSTYREPRPADAPQGRRVEAYAWGLLARFTGVPALGKIGDALVRTLWFALAPYGLANTAYWARNRIGAGGKPTAGSSGPSPAYVPPTGSSGPSPAAVAATGPPSTEEHHRHVAGVIAGGLGAGTMRLFGLLLTLLYITTATSIALDMMARQCFASPPGDDGGRHAALAGCAPVAAVLRGMLGWSTGERTALLLLLPLFALAVVFVLPQLARTRYLPGPHPGRNGGAAPNHADGRTGNHADGRTGNQADDRTGSHTGSPAGHHAGKPTGNHAGNQTAGADPGLPLLAHKDLWIVGAGMGRLRRLHASAALAWIAGLVALQRIDGAASAGLEPLRAVPAWSLLGALSGLLVVVAAVGIMRPQTATPNAPMPLFHTAHLIAAWLLLAATVVLCVADGTTPPGSRSGGMAGSGVVLALAVVLAVILGQSIAAAGDARSRVLLGWWGRGPFVLACFATGFGLVLSFAAVLLAGWLLGGLEPPMFFVMVGAGFAVLLMAALLSLAVMQGLVWRRGRALKATEIARARHELIERHGHWAPEAVIDQAAYEVWSAQRWAALLRRMETYLAWIGWAVFAGTCAGWALAVLWVAGWRGAAPGVWEAARAFGVLGLWAGLAIIVVLAFASSRTDARPLGLLWDLMCFLPTQAHPFGPPCYSERVVPELSDRIGEWFGGDAGPCGPAGTQERRRVVISAHSMGIVLATCTLFQLRSRGMPRNELERIGMLSYGNQLRRYFGRFFPLVCGPDVISMVPAGPPSATGHNPWPPTVRGELEQEARLGLPRGRVLTGSLGTILGTRWLNLYRQSDPVGFPVRYVPGQDGGADEGMDRRAGQNKQGAYQFVVATHGSYIESTAYAEAFRELAARVGGRNGMP